MNKASKQLRPTEALPMYFVQGPHTWGKAPTLRLALRNAYLEDGDECIVMCTDREAYVDEIGYFYCNARSHVWQGKVYHSDVILDKKVRD